MRLRKKHGGCTIAGHEWAEDGAVAEVPDELGAELLVLAPGEYEQVLDEPEPEVVPEPEVPGDPGGELKQPNKAASADDWKAYAIEHGGFEAATGVHPDDATRKAIVDHYTEPDESAE